MGRIYQINFKPKIAGERGIPKIAIDSAYITLEGVDGDYNRYRQEKKNGNPDWALLLLPLETIRELNAEGWPVRPGHLGENITTAGIPYNVFDTGKRYKIGAAEIQIAEPCTPCSNLAVLGYVGESRLKAFMQALYFESNGRKTNRRGWYARVLKEGAVRKGDTVEELA